jgi:chemotaxis protein MotB
MEPKNSSDDMPAFRPRERYPRRRGGSWKVAYADFVTALMALFIVLWLMNGSAKVKYAVSSYFRDPRNHGKAQRENTGGAETAANTSSNALNKDNVQQLKEKLERDIRSVPELSKIQGQIQISITSEGLRIELLETEQGLFFESGQPEPSPNGVHILSLLASEIARLPNPIVIEGHTDARPYRSTGLDGYGNWELSLDRAAAARRSMVDHGLHFDQVVQVRGFADKHLLNPADPGNSRNRRISVVVQYDDARAAAERTATVTHRRD